MRDRDAVRMDRFSRSPWQEESLSVGFTQAVSAGTQPTVARGPIRSPGQLAARIAGCSVLSFLLALVMLAAPAASSAEVTVGVSVTFGPPALPYYVQPACPGPAYIWTPGYWAWDPDYGYFWVPGTWVLAPFAGALWTPGYWAFADGVYVWHEGYWGPVVGYYGGIFYGFGYTGYGYQGGYWNRGQFFYNRSANNIQTTNITNVYNKTIVNSVNVSTVSYNGGPGGTDARPTAAQMAAANQRRSGPVAGQTQQVRTARSDPRLRASENKGRPAIAATPRPGRFSGREVVQASRAGAPYRPEPRAAHPDHSAARSIPAETAGPAARPSGEATTPQRAKPARRLGHPAPPQVEPPRSKHERGGPLPEQPHPNATRVPMERQPAPRAEEGR
jgi:hypothetical protein